MKKNNKSALLHILILFFCIFVCSCDKSKTNLPMPNVTVSLAHMGHPPKVTIDTVTGTVSGDYIYRSLQIGNGNYVMVKYHLASGLTTVVCQDPYCSHADNYCPFYLTIDADLVQIGNILFFSRKNEDGNYSIMTYNETNLSFETIYEGSQMVTTLFPYQYSLYYTLIDNKQEQLYRYDINSKRTHHIMVVSSGFFSHIQNDWIYCELAKNKYSIYDLDGKYLAGVSSQDYRGYLYESRNIQLTSGWRDYTHSLFRTPVESEDWVQIAQGIGAAQKINDKILYFVPLSLNEQKKHIIDGTYRYDHYGGNVYLMNLDGSSSHLVCHADDVFILGLSSEKNNMLMCGDWIGIRILKYGVHVNSSFMNPDLLLVNLKTGEFNISTIEYIN